MDYKAPKPKLVSRVIEADLKDNMVSYMMNDTLGAIGSAHLAWSDLKGVSSPECIELAHLHSRAVDFSKTGQPANFPNILRPRRWPMYMDKPPSLSYESDKVGPSFDSQLLKLIIIHITDPREAFLSRRWRQSLSTCHRE